MYMDNRLDAITMTQWLKHCLIRALGWRIGVILF